MDNSILNKKMNSNISPIDEIENNQLLFVGKETNNPKNYNLKCAIFVHLHYLEYLTYSLSFLDRIPNYVDIYITTSSDDIFERLTQKNDDCRYTIIKKKNRGRDISSLLVVYREYIKKYDIFCFLHDKYRADERYEDYKNWNEQNWSCLLGHESGYIGSIIDIFSENKYLGVLVPPLPMGDTLHFYHRNIWGDSYELTRALLNQFELKVTLDPFKNPCTIGTAFWARTQALDKLLSKEWSYEDFDDEPLPDDGTLSHAIERSFAYFAQDAGYHSALLLSDACLIDRYYNYEKIINNGYQVFSEFFPLESVEDWGKYNEYINRMIDFAKAHKTIVVFGIDNYAYTCKMLLEKEGVSVSYFTILNESIAQELMMIWGIPVRAWSQIVERLNMEEVGIIFTEEMFKCKDYINHVVEQSNNIFMFNPRFLNNL